MNEKMSKTIAQQLNVTDFPFVIKDKDGNQIYYEDSHNFWVRYEHDSEGNEIYYENSKSFWCKREYDSDGNQIYFEDSKGFWIKNKYDSYGNEIYYEDSNGFWCKYEYDSDGNQIYYEDSSGYWKKYEYDSDGNQIYYEDSDGVIIDNRPKETIKSTWSIRDCFKELRMSKKNHLGFGDIKLTIAQQEEICDLVESLIEKSKTTEQ